MPRGLGIRRTGQVAATPAAQEAPATTLGGRDRYRMKERLLSFGDDFYIETTPGNRAFWVDGKALRVRDTLLFKDMRGNEIYRIQEKVARVRDTMTIYKGGSPAAIVKQAMVTPVRDRYSVNIPGGEDLNTQGNILHHEYTMERGGQAVATISKKWFRVRDTYGVEIAPGQDDLLILAVTVCIDAMSTAT